ncbi:Glycine dehydrogenase [compost metagenome]|jgi:glycine dehydrogenase
MKTDQFITRHSGVNKKDSKEMLDIIGVSSLEALIDKIVPSDIRLARPLNIAGGLSEYEYQKHLRSIAGKNKLFQSYIGLGYYNTILPPVMYND